MTDQDQCRADFERWFGDYHDEACREYGGIDCTNPKGIAEDAWQAALNHKAADATPTTEESSGVVLPEPDASVYTMEALVPGGREVSHVTFHRSLPAGTKLYTEQTVRTLLAKGIKESLTTAPAVPQRCWCETCDTAANGWRTRMALCPTCGNKRCPRANHHGNVCTGSNAPGQPGSSWEHVKPAPQSPKEQT